MGSSPSQVGPRVASMAPPQSPLPSATALDLAVVLPTFNERPNVPIVIERLSEALRGLAWEAIFVDDDSPDGTANIVAAHARWDPRIRLIHRVGRRGLSSACIEGMMSTTAQAVAVMDADLQHDERLLPRMLERLREEGLDIVIGTRNSDGGSMGEFTRWRVLLSRAGEVIGNWICHSKLTDPMSGFFVLRRVFLLDVVGDLQGGGFKILVDLLAASRAPVRFAEVGYRFGARQHGESKLDVVVGLEYLLLILNRRIGGVISLRLVLYALIGGIGIMTHLLVFLVVSHFLAAGFVTAQIAATIAAMIENFALNNLMMYRDWRLRGSQMVTGVVRFVAAGSFGAFANVVFACALWQGGVERYLASVAGIVVGSVWNLSISSAITWEARMRNEPRRPGTAVMVRDAEVSH